MAFASTYFSGGVLNALLLNTQAFNFDTDTLKLALYTDSAAGNKDTLEVVYPTSGGSGAYVIGNECSSTNYTSGGVAFTNPAVSFDTTNNLVKVYESGTPAPIWNSITCTSYGGAVWDDTVGDYLICAINWGSAMVMVAGTFTVSWSATYGVFYFPY